MPKPASLDQAVLPASEALALEGWLRPDALLLLGTGPGHLAERFDDARQVRLRDLPGAPEIWRDLELTAGRLGQSEVWLLPDAPEAWTLGEANGPERPAWERAWPVWLASAAGAGVLVLSAAGILLDERDPEKAAAGRVGALTLLRDHINLSGRTPLVGLGETSLGPLFPDQTRTHDPALRLRAGDLARERGLECGEAIAALLAGPALCTPAELAYLSSSEAQVAVQDLVGPLHAAAHSGLLVLAIVALTDSAAEPLRMSEVIERADRCAPQLEELLLALGPELAAAAKQQRTQA